METQKDYIKESSKHILVENDDKINVEGGLEEMGEIDTYWVKENKGNQTADIKFPTFYDNNIELQLREDISFDHLTDDINSIIELLLYFEKSFLNLLKSKNKTLIQNVFNNYNLNHVNFIAYSVLSRRQITLTFYLVKLKYEGPNTNLLRAIDTDYKNSDPHKIIEEISIILSEIDIKKEDEIFSQVESLVKKNLEHEKKICENECKPSIVGISIAMKFFKSIVDHAIANINTLQTAIKEDIVIDFLHTLCKLEIIHSLIYITTKLPHDDIFNYPEDSETWIKLKQHMERKILFSKYTMERKLNIVFDFVILGNASVSKGDSFKENISKVIGTGWYMTYFFFNSKEAKIQSKKFFINPSTEIARKVWNLIDTKGIKNLFKLALPSIKYRKKLFVRRSVSEIDVEYIKRLLNKIKEEDRDMPYKLESSYASFVKDKNTSTSDKSIYQGENLKEKVDKNLKKNYVQIKILFSRDFVIPKFKPKWRLFTCCAPESNHTRNSLIIHIHGGGFVAMSSTSHENYLRKWVNELNVPLISIDYRLAPDHPYPAALDDCWQAYNWILKYAQEELEIEIEKIILVGDSAGGNLSLAITYLSILHNIRLPNALFLVYPAVRLDLSFYTPSSLLCINDIIIPYHLLRFCASSYIGKYDNDKDPFINPILMDDTIIKRLPFTRIYGGSSDPMRDEFVRFTKLLIDNKVDCKYNEFKYFPHGFLNYDLPLLMPEVSKVNEVISRDMDLFIQKTSIG